jgi:adenylosuccinate synthase
VTKEKVRFNGGHQAGHTVVQNGIRHVFSSFGSGTLVGCPTYTSKYCTIFPPALVMEYKDLVQKGCTPILYVDPLAMITTPFDVAQNRYDELNRIVRHGSCGSGFGKTIERHETLEHSYRIFAKDLSNEWILRCKLNMLADVVSGEYQQSDINAYVEQCLECSSIIQIVPEREVLIEHGYSNFIFEGAQGILLDREHGIFPHVTRSRTTSANVNDMLSRYVTNTPTLNVHYLCRAYQTRHGNGPLFGEKHEVCLVNNQNETNVTNPWQGVFRTAPLSLSLLKYSIDSDSSYYNRSIKRLLTISHLDQLEEIPLLNNDNTVFKTNRDTLVDLTKSLLGISVETHNSETL